MWKAGRRRLLAACLLTTLLIPSAQARSGALDPTFGKGGRVTTAIGSGNDSAGALVLEPDGKLVAAGSSWNGSNGNDFALVRYNRDGSLDTSFNATGEVTTAFGSGNAGAGSLVLQPDGKLVAAGSNWNGTNFDFALVRYNPDGSLDQTFGSGGKVTNPVGSLFGGALVLQPDGKLVAAGSSGCNGFDCDFVLVRYNPDGSLDRTFGSGGEVTTAVGSLFGGALALQPDGRLVVAGARCNGLNCDFALARYNRDGSLDTSFNGNGRVTTAIAGYGARALALQPDGKLVAAGSSWNGANFDFALARYNRDGSLDTSFGGTGTVTTAFGPGNDFPCKVVLQPDGKLVAGGTSLDGVKRENDFALARYNPEGSLDTSFNGTGTVTTAFGPGNDSACGLALQPDGKLVAAGFSWNSVKHKDVFALARYVAGSILRVVKIGGGSGLVKSRPSGIACRSTCAAPFAAVPVTLRATASPGSQFAGWSGDCSGTGTCSLTMSVDHSVTATFKALCVVPNVKGKTLAAARKAITHAHCAVGKVTRAFSAKAQKGRVLSQQPEPGAKHPSGSKINLEVSRGKKR